MLDDRLLNLERVLDRAGRRLRLRSAARAGAIGLQVGLGLAALVALAAKLAGLGAMVALAASGSALATAVVVALLVGALRPTLDPKQLALLVDRTGGTDELLVTSMHVVGSSEPNRDDILRRLSGELPDPRALLPIRAPRHLRFAALPLVAWALVLWLAPPRGSLAAAWSSPASPVAEEGERLEERLEATLREPEGVELPPELRGQVDALVDDLKGGELSPEEAEARLAELQDHLEALEQGLAESGELLSDLEEAARDLRSGAAEGLGEGLSEGDLEAASAGAKELSEALSGASPEERQRAAEAMRSAGEELAGASDPALKQAGQALQDAAAEAGEGGDGLSPEEAQELAEQLARAKAAGEQLKRDRAALERSQELNGAMESARQRLGGEPRVSGGEGEGEGEGQGEGEGEGEGQGEGQAKTPGNGPGSAHTWEDEGEFASDRPGGEGSTKPAGERDHQQIDDFQRLYEEARLKGARSLVAGTGSQLHEGGRVDELPTRVTSAEEVAGVGLVELPAEARDAATQAVVSEDIPAAYREAVKQYFGATR